MEGTSRWIAGEIHELRVDEVLNNDPVPRQACGEDIPLQDVSRPDTAVVHLLRQCNPREAFVRFVESYRRRVESLPHDLVVIFKGFGGGDDAWALDVLSDVPFRRVDWLDVEFDLGPYLHFGRSLPYRYFCFLNSNSEILHDHWLTKLSVALRELPLAGVVGATGSWQSVFSDAPFPNPHIRTNAFLISQDVLSQLQVWPMLSKWDCYCFESGANGLARQILKMGLEPYVVDRNGRGWRKEQWNQSHTFYSLNRRTFSLQMLEQRNISTVTQYSVDDSHEMPGQ